MTTAPLRKAVGPGTAGPDRLRRLAGRPALWRVTAALAATALAAIFFFVAPGSVELVKYSPLAGGPAGFALPAWARPCLRNRYPSLALPQLAFCARADGRVVGYVTKDDGETHLLVTGGLHVTLVEIPPGSHKPAWGSRVTAVGPLTSTDGLREVQTIQLGGS